MSLTDLIPFDGLSVLTTEMDEIEVAHLLNESLDLTCQDCGGRRFEVEAFIPATLEILAGKHTIVTHVDYHNVNVNRVIRCVHCHSIDFVNITDPGDENNG
jgi:DNA-directed RNA polymerase subunit RPC12/RpoP